MSKSQYDLPLLDLLEATPTWAASRSRAGTSTYVGSTGLRTTVTVEIYASSTARSNLSFLAAADENRGAVQIASELGELPIAPIK